MKLLEFHDTSKGLTRNCNGASWTVLVGTWETGIISELLESGHQLLVIERNAHLAERLRDDWSDQLAKGLTVSIDPIGATAIEASWYCFNDPRLDGLLPLDTWLAEFPNLRLLEENFRNVRTLDDLVGEWKKEQGINTAEGALLLNGKDCLSLLKGAERLLKSLTMILWRPELNDDSELNHEDQEETADIYELMRKNFMIPNIEKYDGILVWNHDYRRELEKKKSEWRIKFKRAISKRYQAANAQAQIQNRMDEIILKLDENLIERNILTEDKKKLQISLDDISESFKLLQKERDNITASNIEIVEQAERDQDILNKERLSLINEKHALIADRDRIAAKNEIIIKDITELNGCLLRLQDEQKSLTKARDEAYLIIKKQVEEIAMASQVLDGMKKDILRLITENENLLISNGRERAEREAHRLQLEGLMRERDDSIAENMRLRENQALLLDLTEQSEKKLNMIKDLIQQIEANPSAST